MQTQQHCRLHPSVTLVTSPRADGGVTRWGCAICNALILENLCSRLKTTIQTLPMEHSVQQMQEENARFEAWAALLMLNVRKIGSPKKYYVSETTATAWIAWLASERLREPVWIEIPMLFASREEPGLAIGYSPEILLKMASNNSLLRYDEVSGILLMRHCVPRSCLDSTLSLDSTFTNI